VGLWANSAIDAGSIGQVAKGAHHTIFSIEKQQDTPFSAVIPPILPGSAPI
jgi:hypothetical protein